MVLVLAGLTLVAMSLAIAFPEIAARFAERRVAEEAADIGEALVQDHTQTGTFPQNVVADNTDGRHPEVLADRRPLPRVALAPGMALYYYSSESRNLGISFCLEHRTDSGQPNAFAAYGASRTESGAIGQTGHGDGCLSAE